MIVIRITMIINTLVNKVNSAATTIQLWWQGIVSDKNYQAYMGKSRGEDDEQVLIIILFIISLLLS